MKLLTVKKTKGPETGDRKRMIIGEGSLKEKIDVLVSNLKKDGYDFSVGIPMDTPIVAAERVVSAGQGIGSKENMKLVEGI